VPVYGTAVATTSGTLISNPSASVLEVRQLGHGARQLAARTHETFILAAPPRLTVIACERFRHRLYVHAEACPWPWRRARAHLSSVTFKPQSSSAVALGYPLPDDTNLLRDDPLVQMPLPSAVIEHQRTPASILACLGSTPPAPSRTLTNSCGRTVTIIQARFLR